MAIGSSILPPSFMFYLKIRLYYELPAIYIDNICDHFGSSHLIGSRTSVNLGSKNA